MDNITQYKKLLDEMHGFVHVNFFKYRDKEVSGVFCSTPSLLRKDHCLKRVMDIITENNFPFTISEEGLGFTNHFEILFNGI